MVEQEECQTADDGNNSGDRIAVQEHLLNSVVPVSAHVLAGKGNGCLANGVGRRVNKSVQIGYGGIAVNHRSVHTAGSENVIDTEDGGLYHHIGQREESALYSCGESYADNVEQ